MAMIAEQIKLRPDLHVHKNENELFACCMKNGSIDLSLIEAHSRYAHPRKNPICDVVSGPCACGAWHDIDKARTAEIKARNE